MTATLFGMLAAGAAKWGDRPALRFRERQLSYRELHAGACGLGRQLAGLGVRPGDRVLLTAPNLPEFGIGYFGILAAGASVLPINPLLKTEEVRYILEDSGATALVGMETGKPLLLAARAQVGRPLPLVVLDGPDGPEGHVVAWRGPAEGPPPGPAEAEAVAAYLYTSGTTGRPKGALLTHANILANLESCRQILPVGETDVFLTVLPLFHAYGATVMFLYPLMMGAQVVLEPRFVPEQILRSVAETRATFFSGVPSMYAILAAAPRLAGDFSSLRLCLSGGAPLPPPVLEAFERRFGVSIYEGYGPTECAPVLTINPPGGTRKIGSVGPPIPGVELMVVDEQDVSLPAGEVGEIVARGANVMRGYLNRPEETATALRGGWYHTGDLGWMDEEGYCRIVDRKTDLILVGGLNVYPSEVEAVLLSHPAVREVAVVGVPDPIRGEVPKAYVVAREGTVPGAGELLQWCRGRLANYKVPRAVVFPGELPRSLTGKVLKTTLREQG
jgi:long-chain acyl-CoA synthetase